MSEKKSVIETKTQMCTVCKAMTEDFLELEDFSDSGFILCCECEARATAEDLYGVNYDDEYASPREGVFDYSAYPRITKNIETSQAFQAHEAEMI